MSAWDSTGQSGYGQYGQEQPEIHNRVEPWRTVIPMHPLSVGETLDASIRLIRFNPVPFIVFPVIVNLVVAAVDTVLAFLMGQSITYDVAGVTTSNAYLLLSLLVSIVANLLVIVAGTRVTIASVRGQKLSLAQTFALAKSNLGIIGLRVLGLVIISAIASGIFLALTGTALVALVGAIDPSSGTSLLGALILVLLFFVIVFLAFYRFTVVAPAMVAEDVGPVAGLARSWNLTKGSLGYFVGMFAAMVGIGIVLSLVFGVLVAIMFGGFAVSDTAGSFGLAIGAAGSIIFSLLLSVLLMPISTAIVNLVYVNMRMKRENFHHEAMFTAGEAGAAAQNDHTSWPHGQAGYGQAGYGQPGQSEEWHGRPQWYGDPDNT